MFVICKSVGGGDLKIPAALILCSPKQTTIDPNGPNSTQMQQNGHKLGSNGSKESRKGQNWAQADPNYGECAKMLPKLSLNGPNSVDQGRSVQTCRGGRVYPIPLNPPSRWTPSRPPGKTNYKNLCKS